MDTIITGEAYDIGSRQWYEDRCAAQGILTPGGLDLTVGIMSDGVGGENRGERAAQIAVDTTINHIMQSPETDMPRLLIAAIEAANQAICEEAVNTNRDMSCTVVIAAICNGTTLYLANVGDSRCYLCRNETLRQITVDHTFATIMTWRKLLSPQEARSHAHASTLMRALGLQDSVEVDLGNYLNGSDPAAARTLGEQGFPIHPGDSILLCSDGLIKTAPDGKPYTREREMIQVLSSQQGASAARTLVSFALGRNADDNVSVVVLQATQSDPGKHRMARRNSIPIVAAILTIIALILNIGLIYFEVNLRGICQMLSVIK